MLEYGMLLLGERVRAWRMWLLSISSRCKGKTKKEERWITYMAQKGNET